MLVVERTDRKERYGQAPSSASHPTVETGAAIRRPDTKNQSAQTAAAEKTREVSGARAEGVGCCVLACRFSDRRKRARRRKLRRPAERAQTLPSASAWLQLKHKKTATKRSYRL